MKNLKKNLICCINFSAAMIELWLEKLHMLCLVFMILMVIIYVFAHLIPIM